MPPTSVFQQTVDVQLEDSAAKGIPMQDILGSFVSALFRAYASIVDRKELLANIGTLGFLELLKQEGGSVDASGAARLYGGSKKVTEEAVRKAARLGKVIAVRDGRNHVYYPVWQFSSKGGVLEGLPKILHTLKEGHPAYSDLTPITFFLNHVGTLGSRPLDALKKLPTLKGEAHTEQLGRILAAAVATHE